MDAKCLLEETFSSINLLDYKINDNCELLTQCEICYKTKDCDFLDILSINFKGTSLSEILNYFPLIKDYRFIEHSFTLCFTCIKQLVTSYLFLEKIRKSNEKFKGLVKFEEQNEQNQTKEEQACLGQKNIKSKQVTKYVSQVETIPNNENFKNVDDCKGKLEPNLIGKHVDIIHDHPYVQDNDLTNITEITTNDDELENIQILIEDDVNVEENRFTCHVCDAVFARKQSLDFHIRRIHLKEKTFLCSICGKQFFLKVDYNRHILLHRGETAYKCNLCNKGFVTASLLKNHKNTVHKNKEIKCSYCPKMFKLETQLKRHIMGIHSLISSQKRGVKIKEKVECTICGKKLNKYVLKTHMERHSGAKKYQCDICGQKFFQQLSLNNHMIRHQDPKFSCEYCGKSHFTKQEMLTHIRRQHTREIVCTCQHCGKGFVHQTNLIQHIRNCHPGENEVKLVEPKIPKQCTTCGKIYSSRTSLIHHRRRAHENKEYPCTECDMTFRNLVPFKSHLKKIHNIGDTYNCDICSKSFYTREDLYKHKKRTHQVGANSTYLSCTVCQTEKFKTKHELIQHIQGEHLNEDFNAVPVLYECNICVTFFLDFEIFRKHLVQEHPDKPADEFVSEYEIGGCKVQYFHNKRNAETR